MTAPGPATPGAARILVVEGDREVRHLLSAVLAGEGHEVTAVRTASEARAALGDAGPALAVLDLFLPDGDGRDLLRFVREHAEGADVPILVVGSRSTPDVRAECFRLGADAFLETPLDPEDFLQDVTARLERVQASDLRARSDALTGLLNRPGLLAALERLGDEGRHAVLAATVDGLGDVSEGMGWATAEQVVAEVATVVRGVLPESVLLGRMAAGEFVALLADDEVDAAAELAGALARAVRKHPVAGPDGETFRVTLSVGVARSDADRRRGEALVERAERRAFLAGEEGGNRVVTDQAVPARDRGPVLVAEDDDITATILVHRLQKEGFETVRFADGQEAYRAALELAPRLVILDVKMPGMDGFEVLERLRRTPAYAEVPIVMLTSMGSETDVVRAFRLGADDFINKPFSPSELIARLRRFLVRGARVAGS